MFAWNNYCATRRRVGAAYGDRRGSIATDFGFRELYRGADRGQPRSVGPIDRIGRGFARDFGGFVDRIEGMGATIEEEVGLDRSDRFEGRKIATRDLF
jgi:hypothetical protein